MMDSPLGQLLLLLAGVAGLLGLFSAVIFWAVRRLNQAMQTHMDGKLDGICEALDEQRKRIDTHDKDLHKQELATSHLRNEVLENMRTRYVRHDDITDIKKSIDAMFKRMDRVIFERGPGQ